MTTDAKAVVRYRAVLSHGLIEVEANPAGSFVLFTDHERVVRDLQAEVEALLEVIVPFGHFALVRSALGSTAPKGGTVYSVCTTLGDAEISAEDFEAAFNAIARNTEAV